MDKDDVRSMLAGDIGPEKKPNVIGFTPDPACDNCGGTGVFETVDNEPIPCTFCLRDAIKRGEIEGTVDD